MSIDGELERQVRALAVGRIALGAAGCVAPGFALRRLLGPGGDRPESRFLARSVGARDLAIGIGTLFALKHDAPVRGWLEAGAVSDLGDCVASLIAARRLSRGAMLGTAATALGGVAVSRWLVGRLPPSRVP